VPSRADFAIGIRPNPQRTSNSSDVAHGRDKLTGRPDLLSQYGHQHGVDVAYDQAPGPTSAPYMAIRSLTPPSSRIGLPSSATEIYTHLIEPLRDQLGRVLAQTTAGVFQGRRPRRG